VVIYQTTKAASPKTFCCLGRVGRPDGLGTGRDRQSLNEGSRLGLSAPGIPAGNLRPASVVVVRSWDPRS
jgi:hypothetical protein